MFEIWAIEADGNRVLVRNDVVDRSLARALVSEGNNGAAIRGEPHRYIAVPDPDAVDAKIKRADLPAADLLATPKGKGGN